MEMSKERLPAFTATFLAIIMTILVLELNKPATMTWSAIGDLRESFFAKKVNDITLNKKSDKILGIIREKF